MNKYQIQIDNPKNGHWDWLCVYANTDIEAIDSAKIKLFNLQNPIFLASDTYDTKHWKNIYKDRYKDFRVTCIFSIERNCEIPSDYDIILQNQVCTQENNNMFEDLYDFMYMGDYDKNISALADMALPEKWTLQEDKENLVLKKYLDKTLERLQYENKVITTEKYCAFNTGLFTNNYEDIYILAEKSNPSTQSEWTFKEFCTEYRFDSTDITTLPERANYFEDPSLLIFDWHYPVRVQYGHILDDPRNQARLPQSVVNSKMKLKIFTGVIDTSIKKVIANYKLAVTQYYNGQIQLLIPLYFEDDNKPDLASPVTKKNGYYQGHTCLTLDMAYNNARVIVKPDCNWLSQ